MKAMGVGCVLFEVEDPKRVHIAYPDKDSAEFVRMAERRIDFWRRIGSFIVSDPDIQFIRPASSDDRNIQAHDLMAFWLLDPEGSEWTDVFNADKTHVSKAAFRRFYLEMTRLQYGNRSEAELRQELPAVDKMLDVIDKSPKQWLGLETCSIVPNRSSTHKTTISNCRPAA